MATTQAQDTAEDRRRAREERGVRSTKAARAAAAERLPGPPRERRPALAALAVLLIVGGAAIAGLLAMRADERVPVLVASTTIAAGTQITAESLTTTQVASEGTLLIPESQLEQLVGTYARVEIHQGQLIDTAMVGGSGMLQPGMVATGAALGPGRLPASGLLAGDLVDLVRVGDGVGEVIVEDVRVSSTAETDTSAAGATTRVTFIVDRSDAAEVAAVAAADQLAAVLVTRGEAIDQDQDR
ncbi:MAG: SAF domain-containing protein [Jiangellaceae bacterium]